MIDREIAILQSMTQTVDLCTRKSADFASLPTFNAEVIKIGTLVLTIREQNRILEVSAQGFTNAKNTSKEVLVAALLPVLKRVQAYASISKNDVLKNAVKLTNTTILRMQESMLSETCRSIQAICQQHATELIPYGSTPEMLTTLDNAIIDFDAKMVGTPQYRGEQKAAKLKIETSFAEAADILKNKMDMLIEIIKDTNPGTYVEYKSTRKLELTGSRTMALKGKAIDATTGKPVEGVTITISKNENGEMKAMAGGSELAKTVKRTSAKGGFQMQTLPAGTYTITATREGFAEQTVTVYVNDGEKSEVKLVMVKV